MGLKIRSAGFKIVTRDLSFPEPVTDATAIRRAVGECLKRARLDRRFRLLGVRVESLEPVADGAPAGWPVQHELPFDS